MKLKKKHYIVGAIGALLLVGAVVGISFYQQISAKLLKGQDIHYLYIDGDDTQGLQTCKTVVSEFCF